MIYLYFNSFFTDENHVLDYRTILLFSVGYSEREIKRFSEETVPPVSVLNNWINSNGRTRYCIDLLITCLEQMNRKDAAEYIFHELGNFI